MLILNKRTGTIAISVISIVAWLFSFDLEKKNVVFFGGAVMIEKGEHDENQEGESSKIKVNKFLKWRKKKQTKKCKGKRRQRGQTETAAAIIKKCEWK